jgi:hypothetical protein
VKKTHYTKYTCSAFIDKIVAGVAMQFACGVRFRGRGESVTSRKRLVTCKKCREVLDGNK